MPLSQVIANDRAYKLKQDLQREEQKDASSDFVSSLLPFGNKKQNKELSSSNSSLSSTSETPNESTSPNTPEPAPRARRRVSWSGSIMFNNTLVCLTFTKRVYLKYEGMNKSKSIKEM